MDRSTLVSTVERADLAFFEGFIEPLPEESVKARTDESASPPPKPIVPEFVELVESCDERCREFLQTWAMKDLPLPVIGYKLQDKSDPTRAIAELAWPDKKVAALLPERVDTKPSFESQGWQVFDAINLSKLESQLRKLLAE
ncbi:MAG: hypothetical protein HY731_03105 [Candidatus Tectomicrobia bacterium]|nr:hypothetical protein [Candidatus Tectomicrobia bacterium]